MENARPAPASGVRQSSGAFEGSIVCEKLQRAGALHDAGAHANAEMRLQRLMPLSGRAPMQM